MKKNKSKTTEQEGKVAFRRLREEHTSTIPLSVGPKQKFQKISMKCKIYVICETNESF